MRNIVLDNNIIIDVLSQERRAKYPASKRAYEFIIGNRNYQGVIRA